jgi:peptide deformylase
MQMETDMIRETLKMGAPRLLRVARPIEAIHDPALRTIVADMRETMHATNGAGLAAPQISIDLRLMIFGFNENPRYPDEKPVPVTTLIRLHRGPIPRHRLGCSGAGVNFEISSRPIHA